MVIIEAGHVYELESFEGEHFQLLTFVAKEPEFDRVHPGTRTQEVIRALIDRTQHCHECLPHPANDKIIHHLRMALVMHEARALERKVVKGDVEPEIIATGPDGHYILTPKRMM